MKKDSGIWRLKSGISNPESRIRNLESGINDPPDATARDPTEEDSNAAVGRNPIGIPDSRFPIPEGE